VQLGLRDASGDVSLMWREEVPQDIRGRENEGRKSMDRLFADTPDLNCAGAPHGAGTLPARSQTVAREAGRVR